MFEPGNHRASFCATIVGVSRRIMIVDDDLDILDGLAGLLEHAGWQVTTASSGKDAFRTFDQAAPDVILLDVNLPDHSGLDILEHIKSRSESTAVIVMSGVGTIDIAVEAMKRGAETFLSKPYDFATLEVQLDRVSSMIETRRELEALRRAQGRSPRTFPGVSKAAKELNEVISRVAEAPSPVLLEGESGSGKGIVARMIHDSSRRSKAPFVDLNCAGLSRELLESELFGHEKGSFTDATVAKPGLFEIAAHGTVFLDEIGELELPIQARLLKALEEKRFRRVGGVRDISVDIRLVAATNRDIGAEVAEGRFRKDLYYRLNVVRIVVPPLRDRIEDIPILANVLLAELSEEMGGRKARLSERALAKLMDYDWPGNVRELRNVLERGMLMNRGEELRVEDLLLDQNAVPGGSAATTEIRPLDTHVAEYIQQCVDAAGGNIREAARRLQVSPSTIYARLRK